VRAEAAVLDALRAVARKAGMRVRALRPHLPCKALRCSTADVQHLKPHSNGVITGFQQDAQGCLAGRSEALEPCLSDMSPAALPGARSRSRCRARCT
jgi:hypothetical protein